MADTPGPRLNISSTVIDSAAGYARHCLAGPVGQGLLPKRIARAGITASTIFASALVVTPLNLASLPFAYMMGSRALGHARRAPNRRETRYHLRVLRVKRSGADDALVASRALAADG